MDIDSREVQAYLYQLNQITGSDPDVQVSMHEVGDALGLDNDTAAQMAEVLFIGGYAELKTLSGGIGITAMGMEALGVTPAAAQGGDGGAVLSGEPALTDQDRTHIQEMLERVKSALASGTGDYQMLETVVVDIKTVEVQMLSPVPKTAVIREVFKSMILALPEQAFSDVLGRIKTLIDT